MQSFLTSYIPVNQVMPLTLRARKTPNMASWKWSHLGNSQCSKLRIFSIVRKWEEREKEVLKFFENFEFLSSLKKKVERDDERWTLLFHYKINDTYWFFLYNYTASPMRESQSILTRFGISSTIVWSRSLKEEPCYLVPSIWFRTHA